MTATIYIARNGNEDTACTIEAEFIPREGAYASRFNILETSHELTPEETEKALEELHWRLHCECLHIVDDEPTT